MMLVSACAMLLSAAAQIEDASADSAASSAAAVDAMKAQIGSLQAQIGSLQELQAAELKMKDEKIAKLTSALESPRHADDKQRQQLQIKTGGDVMELVTAADFQALAARVESCEKEVVALAKYVGSTGARDAGRAGAPPRPLSSPLSPFITPLPPRAAPSPQPGP